MFTLMCDVSNLCLFCILIEITCWLVLFLVFVPVSLRNIIDFVQLCGIENVVQHAAIPVVGH